MSKIGDRIRSKASDLTGGRIGSHREPKAGEAGSLSNKTRTAEGLGELGQEVRSNKSRSLAKRSSGALLKLKGKVETQYGELVAAVLPRRPGDPIRQLAHRSGPTGVLLDAVEYVSERKFEMEAKAAAALVTVPALAAEAIHQHVIQPMAEKVEAQYRELVEQRTPEATLSDPIKRLAHPHRDTGIKVGAAIDTVPVLVSKSVEKHVLAPLRARMDSASIHEDLETSAPDAKLMDEAEILASLSESGRVEDGSMLSPEAQARAKSSIAPGGLRDNGSFDEETKF